MGKQEIKIFEGNVVDVQADFNKWKKDNSSIIDSVTTTNGRLGHIIITVLYTTKDLINKNVSRAIDDACGHEMLIRKLEKD